MSVAIEMKIDADGLTGPGIMCVKFIRLRIIEPPRENSMCAY